MFYYLYKTLFYILTGCTIDFGNYSIINHSDIVRILSINKSYNHYAATLLKLDKNLIKTPVPKGKRYRGLTKMNFTRLVSHGLDAISIFTREAIIRIIMISVISEIILLIIAMIIIYLRFFSNLLILGQATTVLFFLIVLSFVFGLKM